MTPEQKQCLQPNFITSFFICLVVLLIIYYYNEYELKKEEENDPSNPGRPIPILKYLNSAGKFIDENTTRKRGTVIRNGFIQTQMLPNTGGTTVSVFLSLIIAFTYTVNKCKHLVD